MKLLGSVAAIAVLCALTTAAQSSLTGKWQGETNNGAQLVLDLTVKETILTGTLTRDGQSSALSDGKVSKNTFTFTAQINDRTEKLAGELAGDEIKIWLERQGSDRAIVLKREKHK
jgi:ABC-type branched-subunit amino acid transport system ATPase component